MAQNLTKATLKEQLVSVSWECGETAVFHAIWLYDNCPSRMHPKTWEKIADVSDIDLNVEPKSVAVSSAGELVVTWPDGRDSRFDSAYLMRHRAFEGESRVDGGELTLWESSIMSQLPQAEFDAIINNDEGLLSFLKQVRDIGFSIVRNMPDREWSNEEVAARIAYTRQTNFGRRFDVVSMPDPNNQAYTHDALPCHTDLTNWETPPGVQFLHCLVSGAEGGESRLVDGFKCAELLREQDAEAWELLTKVPLSARFHDRDWDLRWRSPAIRLHADGSYHEIRYNPGLAAPYELAPEMVKPVYTALQKYAALLKDPGNEIAFKLEQGDMMVFNNRRILHGRTAFDPNTGPRKLQGIYVDLDEWNSRIRVLEGANLEH